MRRGLLRTFYWTGARGITVSGVGVHDSQRASGVERLERGIADMYGHD